MVTDFKTFAYKWCTIAAQFFSSSFFFLFCEFCLPSRIFLVSVLLPASVERFFVPGIQDFLDKVMELVGGGSVINEAYPI